MSALRPEVETVDAAAAARLRQAFERFNESSGKLELKYQELCREVEALRCKLREKEEEVRRSERLALLGETAAGIAHEVRNPLGAIRLFTSLLKRDLSDRPDSLALAEQIEKSVISLDRVVANILQFSREQKWECAPLNVHMLIGELLAQFEADQTNSVTFEAELAGNPFIIGNEAGLRQVFYNLILNAVQAVRGRGRVWLTACDDVSGGLRACVRDDGPGVPEELRERIFDPFVTSKNEGTGLGLAIVKRIVDQHGAVIRARNCPGAELELVLPRRGPRVGGNDLNGSKRNEGRV